MTIGNDLEHRLDGWMQEDANLPDDLAEVLTQLPKTPQRRHRWSFTLSDLTWRTRTMFSATRVAAVIAIFTFGASVALIAAPLGPATDRAPGPAAAEADVRPVFVSGAGSPIVQRDPGTVDEAGAVPVLRGHRSSSVAEMDDERVSGTYTVIQDAQNNGGMGPMWGTVEVANDEGAWQGPVSGYWTANDSRFSGCLTGDGAYTGLTYCVRVAGTSSTLSAAIDGVVYQGDPPLID